MTEGKTYIYENSAMFYVDGRWKRIKYRKEVKFTTREGAWYVFEAEHGTELRLHVTDIQKFIKEVKA